MRLPQPRVCALVAGRLSFVKSIKIKPITNIEETSKCLLLNRLFHAMTITIAHRLVEALTATINFLLSFFADKVIKWAYTSSLRMLQRS